MTRPSSLASSPPLPLLYNTVILPLCTAQNTHTKIITSLAALPHPEYNSPPNSEVSGAADDQQQQQQQQVASLSASQQQEQDQQQQQQAHSSAGGGYIELVASTKLPQAAGCPSTFCLKIPKLPGYFTGTGML